MPLAPPFRPLSAAPVPPMAGKPGTGSVKFPGQKQGCAVCGTELSAQEEIAKVCAAPACHMKFMADHLREQGRQRRAALEQRLLALRDQEASAAGIAEPERFPPTVLPAFRVPLVNLAQRRQRAFRDHLNRVLGQATAHRNQPLRDDGPPRRKPLPLAVETAMGQGCAACQGFCCRAGGDHAYLKVRTLRRALDAHPEMRPREVLAAYLDRLPQRTAKGSCIFHGAQGCTLPRELRSDTCNDYLCEAMETFRLGKSGAEPVRAFFVAMQKGNVEQAVFAEASAD